MDLGTLLVAALIGLGLLAGLGLSYRLLVRRGDRLAAGGLGAALASREGLAGVAGALSAGLALAVLPWPLGPLNGEASWLWAWAGFELAFLLPLLPALASGAPAVGRAAIREAQIGVAGRAALWLALGAALALRGSWGLADLPAHLLAGLAALLALPAAIGWGPFANEERVTPGGPAAGLPAGLAGALELIADLRAGAVVGAVALAVLPTAIGPPWLGLCVALAGALSLMALLRALAGRLPRQSLPAALRYCGLGPAPLAAAALAATLLL